MKTLRQALLAKILFIGEEIPMSLVKDKRPKFILLGTPQQLIDETISKKKNRVEAFRKAKKEEKNGRKKTK